MPGFLRPGALRRELEEARARNAEVERRLQRARHQLEEAKGQNRELRQKLKQLPLKHRQSQKRRLFHSRNLNLSAVILWRGLLRRPLQQKY